MSLGFHTLGCQNFARDAKGSQPETELQPEAVAVVGDLPTSSVDAQPVSAVPSAVRPVLPEADVGGEVTITGIERYGAQDTARIVVFMSQAAGYEVGDLPEAGSRGPRMFLDIAHAHYDGVASYGVGGVVQNVRVGQHQGFVRVALDLREASTKRVFFLPEPFRLVIDIAAQRVGGGFAVPRLGKDLTRVVLDPGHGGHDPGAIGSTGLLEKDVALDVALRAAPLIARELGISTLLTRESDEYVALDERVAKANAFHADLFISIHCNASYTAESNGVMTFVLDSSRDRVAQQVAARENEASEAASTQLARAMRQFMDTGTVRASHRFARLLQRAGLASLSPDYPGVVDGGVRRAGFYVLAGAHMPAVLFEASFISNPTEELRLESSDYRQRLADGVVNAIRAYQVGL